MILLSLLIAAAIPASPAPPAAESATVITPSGLRFQVLRPGPGDAVLVTYEGRLADGTIFDAATQPIGLRVADMVPGFAEALALMNEGGRYRFRIPSRLGYGARGLRGAVPPNAELDFTLALIRIGRPARR